MPGAWGSEARLRSHKSLYSRPALFVHRRVVKASSSHVPPRKDETRVASTGALLNGFRVFSAKTKQRGILGTKLSSGELGWIHKEGQRPNKTAT